MKTTKKSLIPTLVVIATLAIATGVAFALYSNKQSGVSNTQPNSTTPSSDDAAAKSAMEQAVKARADNQYDTAKTLYEKARAYYVESNNLEKQAEIDALLSLIEVEKQHDSAPAKPRLAGE